MNKEETVAIVERVWASWGSRPENPEERKQTYAAWFEILSDIERDLVAQTVNDLITADGYKPRPGTVRRKVLLKGREAPTKAEAWNEAQKLRQSLLTGNNAPAVHPLTLATINKIGSVADLNTGADREFFLNTYTETVNTWEAEITGL
jgi:hypothetical protein